LEATAGMKVNLYLEGNLNKGVDLAGLLTSGQ
jgi:hypothetical protein